MQPPKESKSTICITSPLSETLHNVKSVHITVIHGHSLPKLILINKLTITSTNIMTLLRYSITEICVLNCMELIGHSLWGFNNGGKMWDLSPEEFITCDPSFHRCLCVMMESLFFMLTSASAQESPCATVCYVSRDLMCVKQTFPNVEYVAGLSYRSISMPICFKPTLSCKAV